jgi:hypothetical protein
MCLVIFVLFLFTTYIIQGGHLATVLGHCFSTIHGQCSGFCLSCLFSCGSMRFHGYCRVKASGSLLVSAVHSSHTSKQCGNHNAPYTQGTLDSDFSIMEWNFLCKMRIFCTPESVIFCVLVSIPVEPEERLTQN